MDVIGSLENTIQTVVELDMESASSSNPSTTEKDNDIEVASSEFEYLHKCTTLALNQDKRRELLLSEQKMNRNKMFDGNRDLSESLKCNEHMSKQFSSDMYQSVPELLNLLKNYKPKRKHQRPKLMFSEWLNEVPSNLETEWLVKCCPIGVRNLVVATKSRVRAYNKCGVLHSEFQSIIMPDNTSVTILDCIFNKKLKCFFVLDVLMWRGFSLITAPASLRFFWLRSKFSELPIQDLNKDNEYPFIEAVDFPAELSLMKEKLSQPFMEDDKIVPLDGILFYHKEAWYKSGYTPLVGWLKPYMVPEVLQIPVCAYFMRDKPKNYISFHNHLENLSRNKTHMVMEHETGSTEEKME